MKVSLFNNLIWKVSHSSEHICREIQTVVDEISLKNDRSVLSHISVGSLPTIVHGSHDGMYSLQLFNKYEDILSEFLDFVDWEIQQYCKSVSWKHSDYRFIHSWMNMTQKDTYQEWHIHANSTISGVYYHNTSVEQGGIIFKNPNPYVHLNVFPGLESHPAGIHFAPEPNTLFLFPSWMEHKTDRNRSDRDRTSIAFNITTY
jgi:uncharacterized protein (TIGR02466 family)